MENKDIVNIPFDQQCTFNKIKHLQTLIKKEYFLKEECKYIIFNIYILLILLIKDKKTEQEIIKKINDICYDIYENKIEIHNMIYERLYNEEGKYVLNKNDKEGKEELLKLKGLNIYINSLMQQLWEQPKLVYLILSNANIKDMKNNLAYFICNNFYENILNPNYLEDNLLFVISLLLKKEINNLNKIKDVNQFLMESTCGFLLEQLKERRDIQLYFKKILTGIIEKIETSFCSKNIDFDLNKIEEEIKVLKEGKNDPKSLQVRRQLQNYYLEKNKEIILNFDENNENGEEKMDKEQKRKQLFYMKYMVNMTLDELNKMYKKIEDIEEKDIKDDMKIYIELQINICKNNEEIFQNNNFLDTAYKSQISQDIFTVYLNMFIGLIEIIDELIQNLLDNVDLMPYSIKVITKIILLIVKKKFPSINTIEQNMFLSKFFLNQLLSNFLNNPSLLLLINNILSENTLNNIKLISKLLLKLISCKLYENYSNQCKYTPFNWFFFEQMPKIIKFYKNVTKNVQIPPFINKLINGELDKSLTFEYFKEKNEIIGHKSICYSYNDLFILLDNIDKSKTILFIDDKSSLLKKTYDKLTKENAVKIFKNIKNPKYEILKSQNEKEDIKRPIIKYFLISDLLINNKKTNLLKKEQNENIKNDNLYSIKNNMCSILNDNKIISEADFDINIENIKDLNNINLIQIFNKLKQLNDLSYYSVDGTIPENKNINWLINDLNSLQEELKKNDYQNLLSQIYKEKNLSINNINYKDLTYCIDKLEIAKRYNNIYQQSKNIILDIDINNKIKSIVDNVNIPVELYFKFNQKVKELKIEKIKKEKKSISPKDSINVLKNKDKKYFSFEFDENCQTINDFINVFPDISTLSELNEENIFDIYKTIKINKKLEQYFKIIENHLSLLVTSKKTTNNSSAMSENTNYYFNKGELEKINLKIRNYIMEKLYERIFPRASDILDNKIYLNSLKLSWTEPKHYLKKEIIGINNNNFDFKRFVSEMKILIMNVEKEKVPLKKVELIYNIIEIMDKCFTNRKISYGQDFFKNLLIYTIVKAKPNWLHSNCLFIKVFIENHTNKTGESMLEILNDACNFFNDISHKSLLNVQEKEFNEKCEKSFHEIDG